MNGHVMQDTMMITRGVIDSGTTFVYVPERLFNILMQHFDWFCLLDPVNHCKGKRVHSEDSQAICFKYDEKKYPMGVKDYFMSFPVLGFQVDMVESEAKQELKWYPSEYMYRARNNLYCLALEKFNRPNEILLGGTFMRQNNIIFDIAKKKIGMARATCSSDPALVLDQDEMATNALGDRYVRDLDKEVAALGSPLFT